MRVFLYRVVFNFCVSFFMPLLFALHCDAQDKIQLDINLGHPGPINFIQPSRDGRFVFVQGGGYFKKWDLQSRSAVSGFRLDVIGDLHAVVDESHDRIYMAAGVSPGLDVLELSSGKILKHIGDREYPNAAPMALDSARHLLYVCSQVDNCLVVVDTRTDSVLRTYTNLMPMAPVSMGMTHDGKLLVISSGRSTGITKTADSYKSIGDTSGKPVTRLFRASDATLLNEFDHPLLESVETEFSADDSRLMTVCVDTIKIWDTKDYHLRSIYTRGADSVCLSASFNNKGDTILAGFDKKLFMISVVTGRSVDSVIYPYAIDLVRNGNNLVTKPALGKVRYLPNNRYAIAAYITDNNNLLIWDLRLKKSVDLQTRLTNSQLILFNHKASIFVTSGNDNLLRVWDTRNNQLAGMLSYRTSKILSMDFSSDDHYLLTGSEDGKIVLWDMHSFSVAMEFTEHRDRVLSVKFLKDSRHFVSAAQDNRMKFWTIESPVSLNTVESVFTDKPNEFAAYGAMLVDGNKVIISRAPDKLAFYHLSGKKILRDTMVCQGYNAQELTLSPDGRYLITNPAMAKDSLFSLEAMKLTRAPRYAPYYPLLALGMNHLTFDIDNRRALVSGQNQIILLDMPSGKVRYYRDADGEPEAMAFHPAGGFLTVGTGNATRLWSDSSDSLRLSTFSIAGGPDYVSVTADNFYHTTKRGIESLGFLFGGQHFLFEQFDYLLDRPDKVLQAWPGSDKGQVKLFRDAYVQYLGLLHISELEASNPDPENMPRMELSLVHPSVTTLEQAVKIRITADHSPLLPLRRLLLWLNNVPVTGGQGVALSLKQGLHLDTIVSVRLLPGTNYISAAVVDKGARMSRIGQVIIESCSAYPKPDLYLVTIGINHFDHITEPLFFAEKDANDIRKLFAAHSSVYGRIHNLSLRGSRGTADTVDHKRLFDFFSRAKENDRVIVFISSHGMLDGQTGVPRAFLAMKKTDVANLDHTAMSIDRLETELAGIRCLNKAVLIDACHAGKEPPWTKPVAGADTVTARPVELAKDAGGLMLPNQKAFSLMESTFRDSRRKGGVTVISASGGLQIAQEKTDWKNGAFTKTLLKGVKSRQADIEPKDGKITIKELAVDISEKLTTQFRGKLTT